MGTITCQQEYRAYQEQGKIKIAGYLSRHTTTLYNINRFKDEFPLRKSSMPYPA